MGRMSSQKLADTKGGVRRSRRVLLGPRWMGRASSRRRWRRCWECGSWPASTAPAPSTSGLSTRSASTNTARFFGTERVGVGTAVRPEPVRSQAPRSPTAEEPHGRNADRAMTELAAAVDEVLLGVGDDITEVRVQAVPRLPAAAELCPRMPVVAEGKLFAYLKDDPKEVVLVSGFTRDVTELGHQGTGGLADWRTGSDECRPLSCEVVGLLWEGSFRRGGQGVAVYLQWCGRSPVSLTGDRVLLNLNA